MSPHFKITVTESKNPDGSLQFVFHHQLDEHLSALVEKPIGLSAAAKKALKEIPGIIKADSERRKLRDAGMTLFKELLPQSIGEKLRSAGGGSVSLTCSGTAIGWPWEIFHDGHQFIGEKFAVGRHVPTSPPKGRNRAGSQDLGKRILFVIGDAPSPERAESAAADLLKALDEKGWDAAPTLTQPPLDEFREEWVKHPIIHFSGHGIWPPSGKNKAGLQFSRSSLLSINAIRKLGGPTPFLVFVNACSAGIIDDALNGIAGAFLDSGVSAYVGCSTPVTDELAYEMARHFYYYLADGESVGESLRLARRKVEGSMWGAYCLYGDPRTAIAPKEDDRVQEGSRSVRKSTFAEFAKLCNTETLSRIGTMKGWRYFPETYVERAGLDGRLFAFVENHTSSAPTAQIVLGGLAMGKTSLLCHIAEEYAEGRRSPEQYGNLAVVYADVKESNIATALRSHVGSARKDAQSVRDMIEQIPELEANSGEAKRPLVLLVIDALDESSVSGPEAILEEMKELVDACQDLSRDGRRAQIRIVLAMRKADFERGRVLIEEHCGRFSVNKVQATAPKDERGQLFAGILEPAAQIPIAGEPRGEDCEIQPNSTIDARGIDKNSICATGFRGEEPCGSALGERSLNEPEFLSAQDRRYDDALSAELFTDVECREAFEKWAVHLAGKGHRVEARWEDLPAEIRSFLRSPMNIPVFFAVLPPHKKLHLSKSFAEDALWQKLFAIAKDTSTGPRLDSSLMQILMSICYESSTTTLSAEMVAKVDGKCTKYAEARGYTVQDWRKILLSRWILVETGKIDPIYDFRHPCFAERALAMYLRDRLAEDKCQPNLDYFRQESARCATFGSLRGALVQILAEEWRRGKTGVWEEWLNPSNRDEVTARDCECIAEKGIALADLLSQGCARAAEQAKYEGSIGLEANAQRHFIQQWVQLIRRSASETSHENVILLTTKVWIDPKFQSNALDDLALLEVPLEVVGRWQEKWKGNTTVLGQLDRIYEAIGCTYANMGQTGKAIEAFQNVVAICEDLAARAPKEWQRKIGLARGFRLLCGAWSELENHEMARDAGLKEVAIWLELAASERGNTDFSNHLRDAFQSLSGTYSNLKRYDKALYASQEMVSDLRDILASEPTEPNTINLSNVLQSLAVYSEEWGHHEIALKARQEALEIWDGLSSRPLGFALSFPNRQCPTRLEAPNVTHAEMSLVMDSLINGAFRYIKETGGLFPSLYFFKKGGPVETHLTSDESRCLVENPGEEFCSSGIYMTVELFDNNSHQEASAQTLVRNVVARCNPDAVGIMLVAHYKQFTPQEHKKLAGKYNLALDPDAIRVIHACYYIRGVKDPAMRVIPFIDRSGEEPNFSVEQDAASLMQKHEGDVYFLERDVHFVKTPWLYKGSNVEPWLKNPY